MVIKTLKPSHYLLAALLLFLAILPLLSHLGVNAFYLDLALRMMIFAIAASSLNLILGYGGLISLGHAVYLLIGAYSVAIPNFYGIDNGYLHLLLALCSGALFALLTGAICLRTQNASFIMITLAFAQMVYFLFVSLETFGGSDGININLNSRFNAYFFELDLAHSLSLYFVVLGCLVLVLFLFNMLNHARFGSLLNASRQNPARLKSLGYSPYRIQLSAYVIAGTVASLAGFLLANFTQFITPEMMDWLRSAELIFMVALGGVATLAGPVIGAFSFIALEHFLSEITLYWHFPFGLFLIGIAVFNKGGLSTFLDGHHASKRPSTSSSKPSSLSKTKAP